jgi:hypothetical protein
MILFLSTSQYCVSKSKVKNDKENIAHSSNDTFCISNVSNFKGDSFILLDACSVVYSDSLSLEYHKKLAKGELEQEINFQAGLGHESYSRNEDTLAVKYIYVTKIRGTEIRPVRFIAYKDSLHIFETIKRPHDAIKTEGQKIEGVYYRFLIRNAKPSFIIRRFTTNLSPGISYMGE